MTRYRAHYVRYSPHAAGLDSAQALRLYERGQRWTPIPGMQFAFAVDPPFRFSVARLPETHAAVWELEAPSLGAVYNRMQADRMGDDERAIEERIAELGLTHTSMSAGDVVEEVETSTFWECELFTGWRRLD
jgi:hypothetical protein